MNLTWNKCVGDKWCPFLTVNLDHSVFQALEGVYIIWHGGQTPWTVAIGYGPIATKLKNQRLNKDILGYSNLGLFVTWARVDPLSRDGVARFLSDRLRPKVETIPLINAPIQVNLPW
jgi:hypothetical protein